ncbi:glycosyltransferase family 4 protein [Methanobacterium sp.]|uniref:glycosyltransferase family 4 protein n=1 Tax=Methanobacterium sp. TaxID=2164 RepID=UPI00315823B7
MKILLVQDADWTKKGPHQQHHLMELLSLEGHEIVVIGFDQLWDGKGLLSKREVSENVERFYKGANVTFIKPPFIKMKILDYISFLLSSRSEIKKSINEFEPDIVIGVTSVLSNYWGMHYARKRKIPFIYYWTDIIHTLIPFKPFQPVAKSIEKNIIKNSSNILVINEVLKEQVVNLGANESITDIIPGGIDFNRFNPLTIDSNQFRKNYGISDDDLLLFFMGWIYEFSGLKEVILELSKVRKSKPHIKLMIVGEGDSYLELKSLVKKLKLEDTVIMTGLMPYNDIPKLIASADICLLPAYNNEIMRDIVPIKMYEYLAMYKPVISTELPGVMKEFGEESGVLYVDKPQNVIDQVLALTEDDIELNRSRAKNFIQNHDWQLILSQFEDCLNNLANECSK